MEVADEHGLDIGKLKDKIKLLETRIAEFAKELMRLKNSMDKREGAHIDEDEWHAIKKRIEGFRKEIDSILGELKDLSDLKNLRRLIMELQAALEGKLDKAEFERWKAENDFNQVISGMLKKFADKNEMLHALKKLEARIAMLEDLLREGRPDGADDALLAKKPLGGWSCASCQKDLINLEGMRVQYYPWAKLPQRNPAERIAKVGQGFSRMLSMLKPEFINKSQQVGVMRKKGYDEDLQMPIEEEDTRPMGRSHGQGFSIGAEVKRPSTANVFPHIQHQKVASLVNRRASICNALCFILPFILSRCMLML
eukprot:TRINITY_DN7850_c0_g2_i14.p1 TRINITY_DN7850_c0_g2~~TRINITY_DN7850_c0_g2_i14.p1  ORF type:complete len:311 (+),score=103.80 TRINITY_DN7850_c0_g2_i14:1168-2100(+)